MTVDNHSATARQRVVTWEDPRATRDEFLAMDGETFFAAVTTGRFPLAPMLRLMGMRVPASAPGESRQIIFEADPAEYHLNPMGIVHGSFAATLLDSAIGHNIVSRLPAGGSFTTLEIKVAYLRAMTEETGAVHTDTTIVSLGRRVASVESRLLDASGRVYATASSTCLIISPEARNG
jgi:uncharacterized protein (TIGR00369 family)